MDEHLPPNHPQGPPPLDPDEVSLAGLLTRFRPNPSPRFYRKIEGMPWMSRSQAPAPSLLHRLTLRQTAFALGLALILLLGSFLAFPSVQAVARQITRYFSPSNTVTQTIQVTIPPEGPQSFELSQYFALSQAEAQAKVDFSLFQPSPLPTGYTFFGAHYDAYRQAVVLCYISGQSSLWLTQRRQAVVNETLSIGPNATVEAVMVGSLPGELVSGGWRITPDNQGAISTSYPGAQVTIGVYWDPDYPQYTLRWQENGMVFELNSSGSPQLSKSELIQVAESIH